MRYFGDSMKAAGLSYDEIEAVVERVSRESGGSGGR
jgi:hypothetical protein